jgi:hypothetical protein
MLVAAAQKLAGFLEFPVLLLEFDDQPVAQHGTAFLLHQHDAEGFDQRGQSFGQIVGFCQGEEFLLTGVIVATVGQAVADFRPQGEDFRGGGGYFPSS